ncbi:mitochondrial ribosomal protein subunit-domain-containing protein [Suillus clintonianus]|uniref:mitochondrial ribosomal protein subunit-domain-containing protein n=1 Tax=Suillus clintonianus TaxID=1904413 RepID=UPI001B869B14|nr:mitochondrial ribosomal protein subunit-domain-containing protein [Suillus clintonianus]KAG2146206.1 mitochondrial ribosomal protein subunit-domain-containing protein [Suillus clintonianus]
MAAAVQSPFATLLKRSKFSSFDPRIAQVYTTHGGDAHRGNWGFKRPLPIRRRGAYITVKAVDSLEQQTEWNSAEPQAMWMKNWDELQINPTTEELRRASNAETGDLVDSEYAPMRTDPISWRSSAVPNIHAMSNLEFKKYVAHIRRRRGDFFKYQEMKAEALKMEREKKQQQALKEAKADVSKESSTSKASPKEKRAPPEKLRTDYTLDDFAIWESEGVRERPRSRSLESVPHRSAGLHYPHFSALQTYLSTKEHKGRLVEDMKGEKGKPIYFVASYAGMGTIVLQKNKGVAKVMTWGDPSATGVTKLRPESVSLEKAPEVVYKRQGLKAAKLSMKAFENDAQSHSQSNTHRPGSLEYITAEPLKSFANHTPHLRRPRYDNVVRRSTQAQSQSSSGGTTLDYLKGILGRDQGTNGVPEEGKS